MIFAPMRPSGGGATTRSVLGAVVMSGIDDQPRRRVALMRRDDPTVPEDLHGARTAAHLDPLADMGERQLY
jgi:hypothetical protein